MALRDQIRIMVVDDMSTSRGLITQALDAFGVRNVASTADGPSALKALESTPVHLVISDYNMPGMTGAEALLKIRRKAGFETTPSIFLTALDDDGMKNCLLKLGALKVIPKPVDFMELPSLIEKALLRKN